MTPEGKEKLNQELKNIAEDHLVIAIDDVYKIAQIYVDDTTNPLDNTILEGLKMMKGMLEKIVDKVDGEVG